MVKVSENNKQQEWYCPGCDRHGKVEYEEHEDVMSVMGLIEDDHYQKSPECARDILHLQVLNREQLKGLSLEERAKILKKFGIE